MIRDDVSQKLDMPLLYPEKQGMEGLEAVKNTSLTLPNCRLSMMHKQGAQLVCLSDVYAKIILHAQVTSFKNHRNIKAVTK